MRPASFCLLSALSTGCMDYNLQGETSPEEPSVTGEDTGLGFVDSTGIDGTAPPGDTGTFPIETEEACSCPAGFEPSDDGDACTGVETFPATATGEVVEVCAIEPFRTYGAYGAQYPGGTRVRNDY